MSKYIYIYIYVCVICVPGTAMYIAETLTGATFKVSDSSGIVLSHIYDETKFDASAVLNEGPYAHLSLGQTVTNRPRAELSSSPGNPSSSSNKGEEIDISLEGSDNKSVAETRFNYRGPFVIECTGIAYEREQILN